MNKFIKFGTAALCAAALTAAMSGCTNYSKMLKEQPQDYVSMASENTVNAMNGSDGENKLLAEAAEDGSFTVSFEAEGIKFSGECYVNEKDGKTAQTYTLTGSGGASAQIYLYAGRNGMKVGTSGASGRHVYDLTYETLSEKLAASIFAPDSGTAYALAQEDYDALLEALNAVSGASGGDAAAADKYADIIENYIDAHPPVTEENTDADIDGETVRSNVVTYTVPKEDLKTLCGQLIDAFLEDGGSDITEEMGFGSGEEFKDSIMSMFDSLDDCTLTLVYYVNGKTHMLMKSDCTLDITVTDESTGEARRGVIYLNAFYGADPESSRETELVLGTKVEDETLELILKNKKTDTESTLTVSILENGETNEFASLVTSKDGENYSVSLSVPDLELTAGIDGTVSSEKDAFELTVDKLYAASGASEYSYSPKGVVTVSKGGEMPELDAEKEFLDITEEEMDTLLENIESDFTAVFEEASGGGLIGSMTGYVEKSKISAANANAKTGYVAASAMLTQGAIDGMEFSGSELTSDGTAFDFGGTEIDGYDYLGDDFEGYFYGEFDAAGYMVNYILWSADPIPEEYRRPLAESEREELAQQGIYIGCYPA